MDEYLALNRTDVQKMVTAQIMVQFIIYEDPITKEKSALYDHTLKDPKITKYYDIYAKQLIDQCEGQPMFVNDYSLNYKSLYAYLHTHHQIQNYVLKRIHTTRKLLQAVSYYTNHIQEITDDQKLNLALQYETELYAEALLRDNNFDEYENIRTDDLAAKEYIRTHLSTRALAFFSKRRLPIHMGLYFR